MADVCNPEGWCVGRLTRPTTTLGGTELLCECVIKLHSTNWFQFFVDNLHNVVSSSLLSLAQTKASAHVKGVRALVFLEKSKIFYCAVWFAPPHLQIKASTDSQGPYLPLSLCSLRLTNSQTKTKMRSVGQEWRRFVSNSVTPFKNRFILNFNCKNNNNNQNNISLRFTSASVSYIRLFNFFFFFTFIYIFNLAVASCCASSRIYKEECSKISQSRYFLVERVSENEIQCD